MTPHPPLWFKQRQCKAEPADGLLKVTGPNLGEAFLHVAQDAGQGWKAGLRLQAAGPDVAATEPEMDSQADAWDAAFELYRTHVIA